MSNRKPRYRLYKRADSIGDPIYEVFDIYKRLSAFYEIRLGYTWCIAMGKYLGDIPA